MACQRTQVMGILNMTPDSFYDGKRYDSVEAAVARALDMQQQGADCIDIGAESTRPGSLPVSAAEQIQRLEPVLKSLQGQLALPFSVDTRSAEVADMAITYGCQMINDVSGLSADAQMAELVARTGVKIVIMHAQGTPLDMQNAPKYGNVVEEIKAFFQEREAFAFGQNIQAEQILFDPGIGFGKTCAHNVAILKHINAFLPLGYPLLVGASRKSFIGEILDVPVEERLTGSLAVAAWLAAAQIDYIRVHDVADTVQVRNMTQAFKQTEAGV